MRKLLALLLTLAMVLSLASVAVVATPAGEPITSAAELGNMDEGGDYYLANDIHIGSSSEEGALITIPAGVTLDGNGRTIYNDYYTAEPEEGASKSNAWTHEMFQLADSAETPIVIRNLKIGDSTTPIYLSKTTAHAIFANGTESTNVSFENVVVNSNREGSDLGTVNFGIWMNGVGGTVTFTNCSNEGSYIATAPTGASSHQIGGYFFNSAVEGATVTFTNCVANAHLVGATVAGFANQPSQITLSFYNCKSVYEEYSAHTSAGTNGAGGFLWNPTGAATVLHFENCDNFTRINTKSSIAAGFLGRTNGSVLSITFKNCVNHADVYSTQKSTSNHGYGGFAGHTGATGTYKFINCINLGTITNGGASGGILGLKEGAGTLEITNCANYGAVTTSGAQGAAGIAGQVHGGTHTITNCVNYGALTSTQYAGGIVANNRSGSLTVSNCMNLADVKGCHATAGLVAQVAAPLTITNCLNTGDVQQGTSAGEGIGGFIGRIADNKQAISVSNSANLGAVTGSTKNGAYGAFGDTFGQFAGCYTLNAGVGYNGDKTIAGFLDWSADGVSKPTFTNCYAYGDAVVADGAKSLTGFVGNDAEGTTLGSGKGSASTIDVENAPNNGLYGINVEATLSNCQTLDSAATAATTLNNLKLFPVTFEADGNAVVVDEDPALKGYQQTADKKSIRFAAVLNDLTGVETAGFTYTVKVNGETKIDNVSKNVNQVLYSVNQTNEGVTSKVLAANNGGQYFYTLTFVNVPLNATVEFTVQATLNGEAVGEAVTLTFVNGEYQAPQA